MINHTADKYIPVSNNNTEKKNKPKVTWWDNKCNQILYDRREAYNQFKEVSTWENYLNLIKITQLNEDLRQRKRKF